MFLTQRENRIRSGHRERGACCHPSPDRGGRASSLGRLNHTIRSSQTLISSVLDFLTRCRLRRANPKQAQASPYHFGIVDSKARVSATTRSWNFGSRTSAEPSIGCHHRLANRLRSCLGRYWFREVEQQLVSSAPSGKSSGVRVRLTEWAEQRAFRNSSREFPANEQSVPPASLQPAEANS